MASEQPTEQSSNELLTWALRYAKSGFPIIPLHTPDDFGACDCPKSTNCDSAGKHPRTQHGLDDASTDEATLSRWWQMWPKANIAIVVPKEYVVLDIDGDEGLVALREADYIIPTTKYAKTGKGYHYWFRTSEPLGPRAKVLPKVDLRGPTSYVVAPPSAHANGTRYEWLSEKRDIFAPAPDWLVWLGKRHGEHGHADPRSRLNVEEVLAGLPEGRRDSEIFRLACKLRGADVPMAVAIQLCCQSAANCSPPFDLDLAERKVRNAYQRYPIGRGIQELPSDVTMLGKESVLVEFEGVQFVFSDLEKARGELRAEMEITCKLPGIAIQEPYIQRINLLSMSTRESCRRELENIFGKELKWSALLTRATYKAQDAFLRVDRSQAIKDLAKPAPLTYLIDRLVPDHGTTILFGAGSSSKTFMSMSMALCITLGEAWLEHPSYQRKGMYIDYETGEQVWSSRLKRLADGHGINISDVGLRYWWANGVPFDDQADAIRRCCDEHDIGFLVLDHIAAACGADPLEPESATRFYRAVSRIGRPLIALAHITGEGEHRPEVVHRPFGTVFWNAGARRTYFILRVQDKQSSNAEVGFYCRKNNDGMVPADFGATVRFSDPDGAITIRTTSMRDVSPDLIKARGDEFVVDEALAGHFFRSRDESMSCKELAEATGMSVRTIQNVLREHPNMFEEVSNSGTEPRWRRRDAYRKEHHEPPERSHGWEVESNDADRRDADDLPFD